MTPEQQEDLRKRARRIRPELAWDIDGSVRRRIEQMRERDGQRVVSIHEPTPPPAGQKPRRMSDDEARAECELTQVNQLGTTRNYLWCKAGGHVWARARTRGHPPASCPEHNHR
jgi:hypothetical protein